MLAISLSHRMVATVTTITTTPVRITTSSKEMASLLVSEQGRVIEREREREKREEREKEFLTYTYSQLMYMYTSRYPYQHTSSFWGILPSEAKDSLQGLGATWIR